MGRMDFVVCTTQESPVFVRVRLDAEGTATVTRTPLAPPADGAGPGPSAPCVASFDASGERLYVGDRTGTLFVCDTKTHTVREGPWRVL
jgi:hypothetical protein